jgi:hypothetical protein
MKLLIMQFSPTSCHTLFSNTLSLCSSLNVRDQVSHPYRTTGKIIVLYIQIFTFLHSKRDYKIIKIIFTPLARRPGLDSHQGQEIFLYSTERNLGSGVHPVAYAIGTGALRWPLNSI